MGSRPNSAGLTAETFVLIAPVQPVPDTTGLTIRPARQSDLNALLALENASFATDQVSRRSFRRFISGRSDVFFVAVEKGKLLGYAVALFRRGTALARLYSIAVSKQARGRGIGADLLKSVEAAALKRGAMVMRLEVRVDNKRAISLYKGFGYREFGRYEDYYGDHTDALRFEKILKRGLPEDARHVPHYAQTTEFTCGPAVMMMAMAAFDARQEMSRTRELRLWREATTIFMTAGHGGCEPIGMAVGLAKRGFDAEIFASRPSPYFLDTVRDSEKREIMQLTQAEFVREAKELGIKKHRRGLKARDFAQFVDKGALAIVLISGYRMFDEKFPHWLLIHAHQGKHLIVHDPWVDPDLFESPSAATNLPIPFDEFDRMAQYGANRLKAAVIVKGRRPQ